MTISIPTSHAAPSHARIDNYLAGGIHNWSVDRDFVDRVLETYPSMRRMATASLLFADATVRRLLTLGVTQFLDIGSGVPSLGAIHHAPDGPDTTPISDAGADFRVVYVDNDLTAVAYAQLHLDEHGDNERRAVIDADLRAPDDLWADAVETGLIDPFRPVGVLLVSILHVPQAGVAGEDVGRESVARLCSLLPKGSFVAVCHIVKTGIPADVSAGLDRVRDIYRAAGLPVVWRTQNETETLLAGLDIVGPGWRWVTEHCRPESHTGISALSPVSFESGSHSAIWAGIGCVSS